MQVWLELTDQATEEIGAAKVVRNGEAQHRYLTWRTEKVCIFHQKPWIGI
jgi:phytochromobilin:ferredoxin oxidoreductase